MTHLDYSLIFSILYIIVLVFVALIIVYQTDSVFKTLGYILVLILIPIGGILLYFSVGQNYRKNKLYTKKLLQGKQYDEMVQNVISYSQKIEEEFKSQIHPFEGVAKLILSDNLSHLSANNNVEICVNGEEKFPRLLEDLRNAQHHIHLEYYIYADDTIGREIEEILISKAKEGVQVRFMYDDFASHALKKRMVTNLRKHGVEVYPFYKIKLFAFAQRLNYRNHRKIVVIDGMISYVGGINVDDRYINDDNHPNQLYWRDTSIRIEGSGTISLQRIFLNDWNFCANQSITPTDDFFPISQFNKQKDNQLVQIVFSGPDSTYPSILNALVQIISNAEHELLIANPYFIPEDSILKALQIAALRGVDVHLMVPDKSDSLVVNSVAQSYYGDLLNSGVKIHRYQKGFIHAKTLVADGKLSVIGTANLDFRSFDLNFEVNALIYNATISQQMKDQYEKDIASSYEMNAEEWKFRPWYKKLFERLVRLLAPLL